ncbi:hypothetical protein JTE90_005007 [Oedothorax gibbosus]|uniref:Uncharacterized protein n=1 Tax=Oedothorax gibbosus TaxID=931172 RepID=A0AAV6VAR2_9ARAC|nr:hypothetical protein JTE90_005007 [Oedothorax gibbosus]
MASSVSNSRKSPNSISSHQMSLATFPKRRCGSSFDPTPDASDVERDPGLENPVRERKTHTRDWLSTCCIAITSGDGTVLKGMGIFYVF